MKIKNLILTLFIALTFTACANTTKNISKTEISSVDTALESKELFNNKDNWQPINKDINFQNIKNSKEVK